MQKTTKLAIAVITVLLIVCIVIILWSPWAQEKRASNESSTPLNSEISTTSESSELSDYEESQIESAPDSESSILQHESSIQSESSEITEGRVPEDLPGDPNPNFQTPGSSYDDIMVNVLTSLLSKDMATLSTYVGSNGLRLVPTGMANNHDVILSASEVADFFNRPSQSYGTFAGSGNPITCTPDEYYNTYLMPDGFDFSIANVTYNEASHVEAASNIAASPKTVAYYYAPNVMEWKRIIMVYDTENNRDVLCGIIYQDASTD